MAKQVIGIGTTANDGTGDQVRVAFDKTNQNFTELYDRPEFVDDSVVYSKLGTEFTSSAAIAASDIDFSTAQVFTKTLASNTTFTFSNASIGMVKDVILTGDFTIAFPAGTKIASGTYDGTVSNFIQIVVVGSGDYWLTISQEAV
jgi:hypothetical protein